MAGKQNGLLVCGRLRVCGALDAGPRLGHNQRMNLDARRPLRSRNSRWAPVLALRLARAGVTANVISVAGVVFAAAGGAAFALASSGWAWLVGAAFVQLRLVCNLLDGLVAVEGGRKGKAGDLFNEVPDRFADTLFLACAGHGAGFPVLGWVCAALAIFTAYVRAFGASLGKGQDFCGPCAKPHRMFLLTVTSLAVFGCWLAGVVCDVARYGLLTIAVLTALTAARRIARLYRLLP